MDSYLPVYQLAEQQPLGLVQKQEREELVGELVQE
jgi:hypothetical protein